MTLRKTLLQSCFMKPLVRPALLFACILFPLTVPAVADDSALHDFQARRQAFLELCLQDNGHGPYGELARLAAGGDLQEDAVLSALESIDERHDCSDFKLHGILRLLYQFGNDPRVSGDVIEKCKATVLHFKYWPDEPGIDSMCTWSENHHILFASAGYLAGQLYRDEEFTNSGRTGREMMAVNKPRILRWLDLRFRTGFSEWLSNVYYDEDLAALFDLADFCHDQDIAQRARMVIDLVFVDIAFNSYRGVFGSTHGRTYEAEKKWAADENTSCVSYLAMGAGVLSGANMSATCLALSTSYRVPRVLEDIANDTQHPEYLNRQRIGIRVRDGRTWGIGYDSFEDGMVWLSLEAYTCPRTINLTARMLDSFHWWQNDFFEPFQRRRRFFENARRLHALPLVAHVFRHDLQRNTREQVDIYTYRTPNYMLSTAQDYRKGYGGDQQHIWQATLGPDAVCFTTHPARDRQRSETPNYWAGSSTLPRAAQLKNVSIVVYNIAEGHALYMPNDFDFTHAWVPKDKFDEVIERDGWLFARKGDGYLAFRSQHPYTWQDKPGIDENREIIVQGRKNFYICELGRRATDGSFKAFRDHIAAARVSYRGLNVTYDSPSQGHLEFGWRGPLKQNGKTVPLHESMRYDNAYGQVQFPAETVEFRLGDNWLRMNWNTATRQASSFE
ncbi:MAG TPA: hypothetical protein PLM14_00800 [Candidatus Hydrogenedentes bacterium]|nr:hypothetical protein [Candidatus Hydrogenedentota bacterium]HQH52341.1 hypothetical protein [Candidatus Hydrogenedentota bacterium]